MARRHNQLPKDVEGSYVPGLLHTRATLLSLAVGHQACCFVNWVIDGVYFSGLVQEESFSIAVWRGCGVSSDAL